MAETAGRQQRQLTRDRAVAISNLLIRLVVLSGWLCSVSAKTLLSIFGVLPFSFWS